MTEQEYHSLPYVSKLPLYSDDDERCPEVDSPTSQPSPAFTGLVTECEDRDEAVRLLSNPAYAPKGAIRFAVGDRVEIRVYFWERRLDDAESS